MIGGFPPCVACAGAGSFQPTREGLFCKWRGSLRGGFAGDNSVGGIGLRVWPTQGRFAVRAAGEIPTDGFPCELPNWPVESTVCGRSRLTPALDR